MAKTPTSKSAEIVKANYGALAIGMEPPPTVNNFEDDERNSSQLRFPRIVMPKGKVWEKFGEYEDTPLKIFQAIIAFHHEGRAHWKDEDTKRAPDCWSLDGKIGTANGQCDACPLKQAKDAKGKPVCNHNRVLYLALLDGQGPPSNQLYTFRLSVTGMIVFQNAMKALEKQGIGYRQVALTFRLKDAEGKTNSYTRLAFNLEDENKMLEGKDFTRLDAETGEKVEILYHQLKKQWLAERQAIDDQSRAIRREKAILVQAAPVATAPALVAANTVGNHQASGAAPWEGED